MEDKIYEENKEIVAYVKIDNKELIIDINEERIKIKDFLMLMNGLIGEYIATTDELPTENVQKSKPKVKGKK
jgi:hypothetical protein